MGKYIGQPTMLTEFVIGCVVTPVHIVSQFTRTFSDDENLPLDTPEPDFKSWMMTEGMPMGTPFAKVALHFTHAIQQEIIRQFLMRKGIDYRRARGNPPVVPSPQMESSRFG